MRDYDGLNPALSYDSYDLIERVQVRFYSRSFSDTGSFSYPGGRSCRMPNMHWAQSRDDRLL
jgi:hypothetical protein